MLTREEQELMLRVTGIAEVRQLREEISKEESAIRQASDAFKQGTITQQAYEASIVNSVREVKNHEIRIKELDKVTRSYRQNVTALGYTFNDFFSVSGNLNQRLNAIANNMPMLLAGFGAIGPVLSGLLPIIGMVIQNWDHFAKMLGSREVFNLATASIGALKKHIKELEEKPGKIGVDMQQLNDAQKALEKLEKGLAAFNAAKSTFEAEDIGASATKLVRSTTGSEGLKKAIFDVNRATGVSAATGAQDLEQAELKERFERLQRMATEKSKHTGRFLYSEEMREDFQAKANTVKYALKQIQASIDTADVAAAEKTAGGFLAGDVSEIGKVQGLARKIPGAFDPHFTKGLGKLPGTAEAAAAIAETNRRNNKERADLARQKEMDDKDAETMAKRVAEADAGETNAVKIYDERKAKLKGAIGPSLRKSVLGDLVAHKDRGEILASSETIGPGASAEHGLGATDESASNMVRDLMREIFAEADAATKGKEETEGPAPVPGRKPGPMTTRDRLKAVQAKKAGRETAKAAGTFMTPVQKRAAAAAAERTRKLAEARSRLRKNALTNPVPTSKRRAPSEKDKALLEMIPKPTAPKEADSTGPLAAAGLGEAAAGLSDAAANQAALVRAYEDVSRQIQQARQEIRSVGNHFASRQQRAWSSAISILGAGGA